MTKINKQTTQVAKGPQLKLKHACKKKLVELGLHSEEEEGATSTATATATGKGNIKKLNTGGGDASGANSPARCCICWENEVEVRDSVLTVGGRY